MTLAEVVSRKEVLVQDWGTESSMRFFKWIFSEKETIDLDCKPKKKSLILRFCFILSIGILCLYFHLFQGIYFTLKILVITLSLKSYCRQVANPLVLSASVSQPILIDQGQ